MSLDDSVETFLHGEKLISEHCLGNVNLRLAVHQVDVNSASDCLTVSGWEEDIADDGTVSERLVGDGLRLGEAEVSHSYQELSSGVGVEVLSSVAFNPLFVPNLRLLALGVNLGNDLIEVG